MTLENNGLWRLMPGKQKNTDANRVQPTVVRGQEKCDEMRTSCPLFVKRDGPIWEHGAAGVFAF